MFPISTFTTCCTFPTFQVAEGSRDSDTIPNTVIATVGIVKEEADAGAGA